MTKTLTYEDLLQFSGCDNTYTHGAIPNFTYTEGVRHVAVTGAVYWLLVQISYAQYSKKVSNEEFQVWKLSVKKDKSAILTCSDGGKDADAEGNAKEKIVYSLPYDYTDFPLSEIKFYLTNGVLMLPGEY